jgi:hypothetical protein
MTFAARVRLAAVLWVVLAFLVWNVIFDRILVIAGRQYAWRATDAFHAGSYLRIADTMPAAIHHGVRVASFWAAVVAVGGLTAVWFASKSNRRID